LYIEEITTGWQSDNDDGGEGYNSRINLDTNAGDGLDYYKITAATYSSGQSGDFTVKASSGISFVAESEFPGVK
jgi:hypothetical protein